LSILIKNSDIIGSDSSDIYIEGCLIREIGNGLDYAADTVIDGTGLTVLPGLFDMHVHFRDPGLEYKEDIITGCDAALAGGFTGVACMPNTSPPIDTYNTAEYIYNKSQNTGVDVYPVGCITKGMNGKELSDYRMLRKAGVIAVSDDGRPVENSEIMLEALRQSNENGLLVISHCEDMKIIDGGIINKGIISEKLGVKGMDRLSEDSITQREIDLAKSVNARIHIAHVSTAGSVEIIRKAKAEGVKVTCETCPHYLLLTDEMLLTKDADYRMNPPLRTAEDVQAVIVGIIDGTIDCIVTDHAPHAPYEKEDFEKAPNGVVGLETSLAATLTALYHTGKVGLERIVELMAVAPRRILGLPLSGIRVSEVADLVLVDLNQEWVVEPEKFRSKSRNSAFKGVTLKGKPVVTVSKRKIVK